MEHCVYCHYFYGLGSQVSVSQPQCSLKDWKHACTGQYFLFHWYQFAGVTTRLVFFSVLFRPFRKQSKAEQVMLFLIRIRVSEWEGLWMRLFCLCLTPNKYNCTDFFWITSVHLPNMPNLSQNADLCWILSSSQCSLPTASSWKQYRGCQSMDVHFVLPPLTRQTWDRKTPKWARYLWWQVLEKLN